MFSKCHPGIMHQAGFQNNIIAIAHNASKPANLPTACSPVAPSAEDEVEPEVDASASVALVEDSDLEPPDETSSVVDNVFV